MPSPYWHWDGGVKRTLKLQPRALVWGSTSHSPPVCYSGPQWFQEEFTTSYLQMIASFFITVLNYVQRENKLQAPDVYG